MTTGSYRHAATLSGDGPNIPDGKKKDRPVPPRISEGGRIGVSRPSPGAPGIDPIRLTPMSAAKVERNAEPGVVHLALNDPDRRNALGMDMFDALDAALAAVADSDDAIVVVLSGRGAAFCAGFDLVAARRDAAVMGDFIERLGGTLRAMRRMPQVVVGAVHGAAIAGGCALVSACDMVVVSASARLGYPVHRIGVSPAVTLPTLVQAVGHGAARALVIDGELIDGRAALRMGLATRLSTDDDVLDDAMTLARTIAGYGAGGLRATKSWLNELDGSLDDGRFDGPKADSAAVARSESAGAALRRALDER
jgi:enoyl-CoA hydratase/carnithine racemase